MKNRVKNVFRRIFHSGTIFTQLVTFTAVVSIVPILFISSLMLRKISHMITEELAASHNQLVAQYTTTLEGKLYQYQYGLKQLSDNTIVLNTLQGRTGEKNPYIMGNDVSIEVNKSFHLDGNEIRNCMIYSNNLDNKIYGTRIAMITEASKEIWYLSKEAAGQYYFIYTTGDGKKSKVLSLIKNIVDVDVNSYESSYVGFVKLDLYTKKLFEPAIGEDYSYSYDVIVLDRQNQIVYSSNPSYNDIIQKESFEDLKQKGKYGKDTMICTDTEDYYGLKLIFLFNNSQLDRKKLEIQNSILPVIVFVMTVIALTAFIFTRSFAKRVSRLIEKIKIAETGDLTINEEIKGSDEIAVLDKQFNQMLLKLDRLIKKNYVQQLENKESQVRNLQLQINPHFLYNTLETISSIAAVNGVFLICDLCEKLGENFRYSLGRNYGEFVTVEQELSHTKNYIYIQKTRFGNKFEAYYNVEPGLEKNLVLRFILQPIVENAIVHGLSVMTQAGTLEISIYQEGDFLMIKIADDGIGMSQEMVEEIRDHIETRGDEERKKQSIGIQNVNQRIKLTYGEEYGITIESGENKGSCFTICLPIMQ
nr:histidine kinase [uncultured Clostridium sp.]